MAQKQTGTVKAPSASEAKERKELEQRYMALKILDQQIKQTQKQFVLLEQQATELEATKEAIEELSKVKPGCEILVPVANGVFVKAALSDGGSFVVNVGANTSVTKNAADVKRIVEEQTLEVRKVEEEVGSQLQQLAGQAQTIEQEMAGILKSDNS